MSENPYEPSVEYGANDDFVAPARTTSARPVAVTVFGVLNLLGGVFGLLTTGLSIISMMRFGSMIQSGDEGNFQMIAFAISMITGIICSLLLFVAGVGLLKWKPYGRRYSIIYAWTSIGSTIAASIIQGIFLYRYMQTQGGPAEMLIAVGFSMLISVGFGSIYPVLVLVFMNSANVKAALADSVGDPIGHIHV